jgi:prepilin-type processing-associated H-X9-DG protein
LSRRAVVAAVAVLVLAPMFAACQQDQTCPDVAYDPNGLHVSVFQWGYSHPGGYVVAFLDGHCARSSRLLDRKRRAKQQNKRPLKAESQFVNLGLSIRDTNPRALVVREYDRQRHLVTVRHLDVSLRIEVPDKGCGTATWSRLVFVELDGSLTGVAG